VLAPFVRSSAEAAALFATAWQGEGDSFGWEEDYSRSRIGHEVAERFIASLPLQLQGALPLMKVRSANLRLLGEAYHRLKMPEAAKATLSRAVVENEALLARSPADPELQRKLALSLWYSAVVHRENDRDLEAQVAIERAVRIARHLVLRDDGAAGSLQLLAAMTEVQAQVLADTGRAADSVAAANEALKLQRRLVSLAGSSPGAERTLAALLQTSGVSLYQAGALARACRDWKESLGIYRGFERDGTLTKYDRQNGLARMVTYTSQACDPPRGGMRIEV
jgi:serine/threonine-protein kinase